MAARRGEARGGHAVSVRGKRGPGKGLAEASGSVGVAPGCVQTKRATSPAKALTSAAGRPAGRPSVSAAVNASPAPLVSATVTGAPGSSAHAPSASSRLPAAPRVRAAARSAQRPASAAT
jgi:hypothetical protein